jgi:hypothetical protein
MGWETYTYDRFEPVGISAIPAAGWRAVYWQADDPGFFTVPLIAWGVFKVTVHRTSTDHLDPEDDVVHRSSNDEQLAEIGNVIEGVIGSPRGAGYIDYGVCARGEDSFWYYLSPDQEDPPSETIKKEPYRQPRRPPRT